MMRACQPQEAKAVFPLFERYPPLGERLPNVSLGTFPTPVQKLDRLGEDIGASRLFVKRTI